VENTSIYSDKRGSRGHIERNAQLAAAAAAVCLPIWPSRLQQLHPSAAKAVAV